MKLSKREVTLLAILVIALLGAVYYTTVLKPFLGEYEQTTLTIAETMTQINDSQLKAASTQMLQQKIKEIDDAMSAKFDKVLESIDRPAMIVMLNDILSSRASDINFGFPPDYQDLGNNYIATAELAFTCTESGFEEILSLLGQSPYINRVISSSLTVSEETPGVCRASMAVEFLTKSIRPAELSSGK